MASPDTTKALIVHKVENRVVPQRVRDGYVNATALCKVAGKKFAKYHENKRTKEFLAELSSVVRIRTTDLVQVIQGGRPTMQGTWVHPRVAISLAYWMSPKFEVMVTKWVLEWTSEQVADRATRLRAYLSPVMREWVKTFPDELWKEFARLDSWHGPIHERPRWWGHLVNTLIYDCLDPDVAAHLRENKPPPRKGRNYHQWLTEDYGLPKLHDHIQQVIGIAKLCQTIRQLQERVLRAYGRQRSLPLQIDRDPKMLWDGGSVH